MIFTTTTGAGRLVSAWGAAALYLGTTVNARAVAERTAAHGTDVVLIPAGLTGNPDFDAQEDRAAAVAIAMVADIAIGEGRDLYDCWAPRIETEGLNALFRGAPHAAKLRAIGKDADIDFCARMDITDAVPRGVLREGVGIRMVRANETG